MYLNDRISFISPCKTLKQYLKVRNHIDRVIVVVLVSSAVDRGFESLSSQTKDYEIGICLFSYLNDRISFISPCRTLQQYLMVKTGVFLTTRIGCKHLCCAYSHSKAFLKIHFIQCFSFTFLFCTDVVLYTFCLW